MGVVHKLREDIRDFILAQKKSFPQLSCRKLSSAVYDKFNIVISKSSVNSVLQAANLSSPIGRHSLSSNEEILLNKKNVKKYKIPEKKKTQIFSHHKVDSLLDSVNFPAKRNLPSEVVSKIPTIPIPQKGVDPGDFKMSNLKDEEHPKKNLQNDPQETKVENGGALFLKAIEWNLAGKSILGKFLKDELGSRFNINFDNTGDLLLFSRDAENKIFDDFDISTWKWLFDAPEDMRKDGLETHLSVFGAAENITDCGMKLAIEVEILLQGIAYLKLTNQDGTVVFIDMKNKIASLDNVQSGEQVSMAEASRFVNSNIIKNVHSAVFYCPANIINIDKLIQCLMSMFGDDLKEMLTEITLYNLHNVEISKYNYCVGKKRTFVFVVKSWENILPKLSLKFAEEAHVSILNKTFFYKSFVSPGLSSNLQVLAVSLSPSEKPFAVIITNAASQAETIRKAVLDFLLTWPGLENPSVSSMVFEKKRENDLFLLDHAASFVESIKALRNVLKVFCQHYFSFSSEQIYSLPALLQDGERIRMLSFLLPANDPLYPQLKTATQALNTGVFQDSKGRRILARISLRTN